MPDWLNSVPPMSENADVIDCGWRLLFALVFGAWIAFVYRLSHGRENSDAWSFATTLVLLCALIAMVTMVIGGSVAKAFSLVGALSIVRFRTVVEDTRDTAFVIFSVIVGMAVGSGFMVLPVFGVAAIGGCAIGLHRLANNGRDKENSDRMTLEVRMVIGLTGNSDMLLSTLKHCCDHFHLRSATSAKQNTVMDYVYEIRLRPETSLAEAARRIAQLDGVQGVELRDKSKKNIQKLKVGEDTIGVL